MIQVHDLRHVDADVVEAWAAELSANLRQCDLDEIEAMNATSPKTALQDSLRLSSHAYVVVDGSGEPIAMFGAAPHPLPGVGIVWMLGTDAIQTEAFGIARRTRRYFHELNSAYSLLFNFVDARNKVSLRWLRWGGFAPIGDREFGGHLFHIYARKGPRSV